MPGTIGDPRLAVPPRRRLRKLRERLMPSQRTLIVLAREHSRYERRALVKKIIFIIVFMCFCAYSIYVLLHFIASRISILLISRLASFPAIARDEKKSGFIRVVALGPPCVVTGLNSPLAFQLYYEIPR